jgi:hypothetical protein
VWGVASARPYTHTNLVSNLLCRKFMGNALFFPGALKSSSEIAYTVSHSGVFGVNDAFALCIDETSMRLKTVPPCVWTRRRESAEVH